MKKYLFIFIISIFGISCTHDNEIITMIPINGDWKKNTKYHFDFDIKEKNTAKNIKIVVRNNNQYPYSNIRFFVKMYPLKNKKEKTDTLNCILAKPNGEWMGNGFGETKEISFPYKSKNLFSETGKYRIEIKQAMRNDALPGIEDLGIIIENAKP